MPRPRSGQQLLAGASPPPTPTTTRAPLNAPGPSPGARPRDRPRPPPRPPPVPLRHRLSPPPPQAHGATPLYMACQCNRVEAVRVLLAAGADVYASAMPVSEWVVHPHA